MSLGDMQIQSTRFNLNCTKANLFGQLVRQSRTDLETKPSKRLE